MKVQNSVHPGEILRGDFLEPLSIAANILAERLSVTTDEVNALLECQIRMTEKMAMKLYEIFGTSPDFWMTLQCNYDT